MLNNIAEPLEASEMPRYLSQNQGHLFTRRAHLVTSKDKMEDISDLHSFKSLQSIDSAKIVDFSQSSPNYAVHMKKQISKIQLQLEEGLDDRVVRLEKLLTNRLKFLAEDFESKSQSITKYDIK